MGLSPLKMVYTLWSMFLLWLLLYSEKTPCPCTILERLKRNTVYQIIMLGTYIVLMSIVSQQSWKKKKCMCGTREKKKISGLRFL